MKATQITFKQLGIGIALLMVINWAFLNFVMLPKMTVFERQNLYPDWLSNVYFYLLEASVVLVACWFAFRYEGRFGTYPRKLAAFAIALGILGGLLIIGVIRASWHI